MSKNILPFGSWPSPISSKMLTQQSVRLGEPKIYGEHGYWVESRPQENGRCVLMRQSLSRQEEACEALPSQYSVRSKAHEYGGASYCVDGDSIYFINAADQRIYRQHNSEITAISPNEAFRYADLSFDKHRQRLIAVREDHRRADCEESNEIVAIDPITQSQSVLVSGHDFFSNPQISPDSTQLSWLCWDHPHMPWDVSECWLADLNNEGELARSEKVAGGSGESIFQPQWSPDGLLYLVSDRNNWWNIYRLSPKTKTLQTITTLEAEFATPQWVFGMSSYGFLNEQTLLATYTQEGRWFLARIDTQSQKVTTLDVDFSDISQIQCHNNHGLLLAASHNKFQSLYHVQSDRDSWIELAKSSHCELPAGSISRAKPISFRSGNNAQAHAFYYPPTLANAQGPSDSQPPLIVLSHGGPTGATETGLNLKIQYWSSRGFAVMDVNYRGSTGYGRIYRQQLNNAWGINDVEDVCAAADYLIDQGKANPQQTIIKGSSAGGYTVLAALTFKDTFKAGASLYGIGDLETLARDTHKFEARYLDSLVGPYPEAIDTYRERSPINHSEQLNCPVIFFQGLDDKVVPPNQATEMVDALAHKGIPVAYVPFEGEGHGFRNASSIERCLEAELSFYSQIFAFDIDSNIPTVDIQNLREQH